jgi:DNA-binding HxlR family transcriptional regulator
VATSSSSSSAKKSGAAGSGAGRRSVARAEALGNLFDLLGRRWALRVLWELRDGHPQGFRLLQSSVGEVSPAMLNTRLKELVAARLVAARDGGYALTPRGMDLVNKIKPLKGLAESWHR